MNFGNIKNYDIANGSGIRVSLFVSGCRIHCPECFNKCAQNFNYGAKFTEETEKYIIQLLKPHYIQGLTILGGEPFEPENQRGLINLIKKVKTIYPYKTIWMYTGYTIDTMPRTEVTEEILKNIDVLVDGPFIAAQKNLSLAFRGSNNQRIIDIPKTIKEGKIILKEL